MYYFCLQASLLFVVLIVYYVKYTEILKKRIMNIVILNWRDNHHPLAGGAEQSLLQHATYWQNKGAHITWVASSFPKSKEEEIIDGIRIVRMGSHYTVHLHAFFYFKKYLEKETDIVIDCFHFIPYFSPFYVSKSKIIALINEPGKNAWFKNSFFPIHIIGYFFERFFFIFYRKIQFITSANSIARELIAYGIPRKDIHIIPHGITIIDKKLYKKENTPTVVFLSQLTEDKGIEDAIKAFALIKNVKEKAKFWIVGKQIDQAYGQLLRRLTEKLGIAKDVVFFGFVSERKKWELLSRSWLLVHPSIREGWGLNILEANASRTPAVGYNVTGLRDSIQDMKTGLLTENNTPSDLASKITLLLNNKKLYKRLSKNALLWSKRFEWNKAGKQSWQLIKKRPCKQL